MQLLRRGTGTSRGGEEMLPGGSGGLERRTDVGEGLPSPEKTELTVELKKQNKARKIEF